MNDDDELVKKEAEIVDLGTLDERAVKAFEQIAKKTFLEIQKQDYRAEVIERTESGEVPSDIATFVHIDESKQDELENPFELDVKGTITVQEAAHFKDVNYALALTKLRDWKFFEVDIKQIDGTVKKEKIPINLAQIDMLSKKRLNMGIYGEQSNKHIRALRAGAGMPPEESFMQKASGWFGWRHENKNQLEGSYGMQKRM